MNHTCVLVSQLQEELLSGKITPDEVIRTLSDAIEAEYQRETPDADLLNQWEDLLWELGAPGQTFVSANDQYLEVLRQHTQAVPRVRFTRLAGTCAAIAAVLALIVALAWEPLAWFSTDSSEDREQLILQGHNFQVSLIPRSHADGEPVRTFRTFDWEEFTAQLGFTPTILDPTQLPVTWVQYIAHFDAGFIKVVVSYYNEVDNKGLALVYYYCEDVSQVRCTIEQDAGSGRYIPINGQNVYACTNMGRHSFLWTAGNVITIISGDITHDEGVSLVQLLTGGSEHENQALPASLCLPAPAGVLRADHRHGGGRSTLR